MNLSLFIGPSYYLLLTSSKRKPHYFFVKTFRNVFSSDMILLDLHDHSSPELGAFSVLGLFLLVWCSGDCWASLVFKEPTTYTLAAQWACLSLDCAAVGWLERKAAGVGQVFSQAQGDGCRPRSWTGAVSGTRGSGHGGGFARNRAGPRSLLLWPRKRGERNSVFSPGSQAEARQKAVLWIESSVLASGFPPTVPWCTWVTQVTPGIWDCGMVCLITFLDIFIIYHQLTLPG